MPGPLASDLAGRVVLVTGASTGIGAAAARAFAGVGCRVAIHYHASLNRAEEVAADVRFEGAEAFLVGGDLTTSQKAREVVEATVAHFGAVDVLVNNAGFAIFDAVADAKTSDLRAMMDTNYFGTVNCTQAVLPSMLQRGSGTIVNVSSITGIMGFARMGGYCATKFAIIGFTESLRNEVMRRGVRVALVCPGTTETEFFVKAERDMMPAASRLMPGSPPERVARAICDAAEDGRYRRILPLLAAVYMRLKELFPRFAHLLMRRTSSLMERR